jgi:DNA-binding PadR family transcriptional regulator
MRDFTLHRLGGFEHGNIAEQLHRHFHGGRHGRRHGRSGFGQSERGSVKYDVLGVLTEGPRHGYEIMVAIEERRGFRPSPGSIYPALQMLDDGDFVNSREAEGKRVYSITDTGRALLETHRASPEGAEMTGEPAAGAELVMRGMRTLHGLKDAVKQIARSGDVTSIERGVEILDRARRELYSLLAEEK